MPFLLAFLLMAAPGAVAAQRQLEPAELEGSLRSLTSVLRAIEDHYPESIDFADAIYQGAAPAMVRTLDPHSSFLTPDQFESLKEMQRSTEKGFGSVLSLTPGRVVVLQALPESPSAKSGLSPGDEFAVVNGYPVAHLGIEQLVALLSQSRRQEVDLMVKRPNFARLIPLTLTPAELADPSVEIQFLLEPGLAYVKVSNYESDTARELRSAIEELGGADLEGLVLDLRGNPGGVVEAAVQMAALFLEPEERILWIQGREGPQNEVRVPSDNQAYRFPMAILIDQKTGSAAELVTAALQDHERAAVLGRRSFGKGLVQSVFELSEGAGLALTTARYLSPSGRPIQREFEGCRDYQLESCKSPDQTPKTYPTDAGRPIPGGGGIEPDLRVYPEAPVPFEAWLMGSGVFVDFARQYVQGHDDIDESFIVSDQILDEFQLYLSERGTRPNLSVWTSSVEFIRTVLTQGILNLGVGVSAGDKVEVRTDPVVRAAVEEIEARRAQSSP